ncbi:MAG: SDR family NAD(P)-dependent oxidoreductase [Azospirillaceae bacterium]
MRDPRVILITGASSGLGRALAEIYATPGVTLLLTGRDGSRLAVTAAACGEAGAAVATAAIDVTERQAMARWILERDAETPIDLVIANAGISGGTSGSDGGEPAEQVRRIFAVNVDGVINTVEPLIPRLVARGRGQVALMSSLASFKAFPGAPAYCASKAAVRFWGEAMDGVLAPRGVRVSVICPGYVRSPMTAANDFPMPFLMDAPRAARLIRRRLAGGRRRIAFPWPTYAMAWLLGCLPLWLTAPLLGRLPRKRALD